MATLNRRQAFLLIATYGSLGIAMSVFFVLVDAGSVVLAGLSVLTWFLAFRVVMMLFGPRLRKWATKS